MPIHPQFSTKRFNHVHCISGGIEMLLSLSLKATKHVLSFSLDEGKKGIKLVKQYASCFTVRSVYYQLWDLSIYKLKLTLLVNCGL